MHGTNDELDSETKKKNNSSKDEVV